MSSRRWQTTVISLLILALALVPAAGAGPSPSAATTTAVGPDVRISELANGGPGGSADVFFEIANFGDEIADLDGWAVYRCIGRANRFRDPQTPIFENLTLAPGQTYTVAHPNSTITDLADSTEKDSGFANEGFGLVLEDANRRIVDAVAIYPWMVHSDCGDRAPNNLPNVLDYQRGQSYQRVDTTGDPHSDFIIAERTPGAPNATEPDPGVQASDVLVSELTNGGPAGSSDNFIELANFGDSPVDISDWEVWRCRAPGVRLPTYQQVTVPAGTVLDPGEVFVAAHETVEVPDDVLHAHYSVSLANDGFGALIEDAEGNVVDAVGVFETDGVHQVPMDSPCTQGSALPNRLDYGFDETYQRFQNTGDNAADFVKAERNLGELVLHDPADYPEPADPELGPVQISELTHAGPGGPNDNFFELANFGDEPVSLQGWTVHRCQGDGRRAPAPQFAPIGDVVLEPGETFLAVREGSSLHAAGTYDAVYSEGLSSDQFGLVVYDGDGEVVDMVGVTHASTGSVTHVHCTMGFALRNVMLPYVDEGQSFQRYRSTGRNVDDFLPAPPSPGVLNTDLRRPADFPAEDLEPIAVAPHPRPLPSTLVGPDGTSTAPSAELRVTAAHSTGEEVEVAFRGARRLDVAVTHAFTGVSEAAPPGQRRPPGETRVSRDELPLDGSRDPLVVEATEGFPYQRFELVVPGYEDASAIEVTWSGHATGRNELQLYAWNRSHGQWELLDAQGGVTGGQITLIGTLDPDTMLRGRVVDLLVQDGPATAVPFSDEETEPNLAFKDPEEYDFSFGYIADTQYLSHGFREVYAEMNRWLVTNQDARSIAYTFHVGDIIQQWFGDHLEGRARDEFQFASEVQAILEDAGHPHGVTPGNHDNKHGRTNDLFNEYFGPDRYVDQPWFGGAWAPDDKQNHYDVLEINGAKFLMVYLGYFGYIDESPDEGIEWAQQVVAAHPDHNVIVATHDYMTPDGALSTPWTESEVCGAAGTSPCSRWNHLAHRYWNEIILPHDNVFLVLAGHRTGVALNVKRDVGGVEGRTVIEMLGNYQTFHRDGHRDTGFLRLLQVDLDSKTMAVNTYSPWLDEHNAWRYDHAAEIRYDDSDDEFTVVDIGINDRYDKRVETAMLGLSGPSNELGAVDAAADVEVGVTWEGLTAGETYQWYTVTDDGDGIPARSPLWAFEAER